MTRTWHFRFPIVVVVLVWVSILVSIGVSTRRAATQAVPGAVHHDDSHVHVQPAEHHGGGRKTHCFRNKFVHALNMCLEYNLSGFNMQHFYHYDTSYHRDGNTIIVDFAQFENSRSSFLVRDWYRASYWVKLSLEASGNGHRLRHRG
jgi:hypothetical protein